MSRKRKTSPIEDMIDVIAMLPWWAGIGIAVIGYLVLHRLATPAAISAVQPGQMSNLVAQSMVAAFAYAGQYLVPLVGLIGAAISFFRRKQRVSLVTDVAQAQSTHALDGMSWREFEMLVGEAFRLQGYRVTETGGGGADGGIDLVLVRGTEKFLVQCKQWKAYKVGVDVVRELYGVMAAKGATGGFVVTSGRFTDDASKFAAGRNVQLIDGPKLFAMIKQAKQSTKMADQQIGSMPRTARLMTAIEPSCPQCGAGWLNELHARAVMLAKNFGDAQHFRLAGVFVSRVKANTHRNVNLREIRCQTPVLLNSRLFYPVKSDSSPINSCASSS